MPVAFARSVAGLVVALLVAAAAAASLHAERVVGAGALGRRASSGRRPSAAPTKLTVGLGYIPSVQFAQFYLADQAGYYARRGPRRHVPERDRREPRPEGRPGPARHRHRPTGRASSRRSARASRSGTSRRSTASSPRSCSARRRRGSRAPPTSRARRSASRAATARRGSCSRPCSTRPGSRRTTSTIIEYPDFGQGAAVAQGAVDAATGFANNEPVQLELAGTKVDRPARRRRHGAARPGI